VQEHQRAREARDSECHCELDRHGSHPSRFSASRRTGHSRQPRLRRRGRHPCLPRRGGGTLLLVADPTRLVVVSCASRTEADQALDTLQGLEVGIRDAAVVTRLENGRVELQQTHQVAAGEGVVAGGTVGFVAGMLLGGPVGGALLGMLGGGVWGARDTGVPDARLRELGESLAPGGALLCALVPADDAAVAREALAPYGEVADADAPAVP
jgi:uncharacterized membrane protein